MKYTLKQSLRLALVAVTAAFFVGIEVKADPAASSRRENTTLDGKKKPKKPKKPKKSPKDDEKGKKTICHRQTTKKGERKAQTLTLKEKAAQKHLDQHPEDTEGPCPP